MTANTFGVNQCNVLKILSKVHKTIHEILGTKYFCLPRNTEEMREIVSKFEVKFGIPQTFGGIDEARVPLKRPLINSQCFCNYKQFFFIKCSGSL